MASSSSDIRSYPLNASTSQETIGHALQILRPHIPVSLPLYRRLQAGRFFDATVLLTNLDLDASLKGDSCTYKDVTKDGHHNTQDEPYLLAFVDRSCRPETEAYLFASWEIQDPSSITAEQQDAIDSLIHNLLQAMRDLGLPESIHSQASANDMEIATDHLGLTVADYGSHAANPNIMLWGSIHERTVPILTRLNYIAPGFKTSLVPNHSFVWDVGQMQPLDQRALPEGLRWGQLTPEHFALVKSRTQIPRQDKTLAVLPNLAIFETETDRPVDWAFVGLDGSLTTLHTEQEWRGKGLAKMLTTKLFKEKMGRFWEEGVPRLAHGYVIDGNKESEGMCRSLGGVSEWQVYWLRVDLGGGS